MPRSLFADPDDPVLALDATGEPASPDLAAIEVSIVVPIHNEEAVIQPFFKRLLAALGAAEVGSFEIGCVNDGSTDRSLEFLREINRKLPSVKIISLSRNFGKDVAISAGFDFASGAAVIPIDADLQDPPELISEFLRKWQQGYKVVYGIRRRRQENLAINFARKLHYRLINMLSEVDVPLDAGDFRLIDRDVIEHLRSYQDGTPYLRGIIASIGYAQIGIPYDRNARTSGSSKFDLLKNISLSIDGICSQSTKPLQYITLFGFAVSVITVLLILIYLAIYLVSHSGETRGFTTLVLLMLISIGLNAAFVGLLGEYIGRIYTTVRGGPTAVIADRIDPVPPKSGKTESENS